MSWTLESFKLFMGYRYRSQALLSTINSIFGVLSKQGGYYVPTEAYAVDDEPFRVRTMTIDLADAEGLIRLGRGEANRDVSSFAVTLYNDAIVEINWSLGSDPEFLIDSLQLSVHRDYLRGEEDAQVLLGLACDLQPILRPVVGDIVDYKVEGANPIPFKYHRNSHSLPERIRWANFWGPAMVERLGGMQKVEGAPAHEVRAFTDGGVLLLSTPTLLTHGEAQDAAQRQAIWEWFDLERLHVEMSQAKEKERLEKRRTRIMPSRKSD